MAMSLPTSAIPMDQLLPHAAPMILIDEVVERGKEFLKTTVSVRADSIFFETGRGIPAHVAIEWMAQTCGAFVGAETLERGLPVRLGMLLGTREFRCNVRWFTDGWHLTVSVTLIFRDDEMGAFDCAVARASDGEILAKATLTLYQPMDLAAVLAAQKLAGQKVKVAQEVKAE
jgi:predicted hotdog family 3-hydroxylacyl-ACP dehydratase